MTKLIRSYLTFLELLGSLVCNEMLGLCGGGPYGVCVEFIVEAVSLQTYGAPTLETRHVVAEVDD